MDKENKAKERFLAQIPPGREIDIERINQLFQPFIFRIRRDREVWTTCCRRHEVIGKDAKPEILALLDAEHTPEPIISMYWSEPKNKYEANRRVTCPWCGEKVKMKELGRCGNRDNLYSYKRPVIMRQYRGSLWLLCFDAEKGYRGPKGQRFYTGSLTTQPSFNLFAAYKFRPGKVEYVESRYWRSMSSGTYGTITKPGNSNKWLVRAPYGYSKEYRTGYDTVGTEEIEKSEFKYCCIRELSKQCDLFRLLTLACFYPDKIEFLQKIGLGEAINDYTEHGVKNAKVINWDAENQRDFIPMKPREIKDILNAGGGMNAMSLYLTGEGTVQECVDFEDAFDSKTLITIRAKIKKYKVKIGTVSRYLKDQVEKYGGKFTLYSVGEQYKDYLIAAEGVGLDLHNRIFLMPKNLREKHDEITEAYSTLLAEKRTAEEEKIYAPRMAKLEKRYAFEHNGLRIYIPASANDIVQEGKTLRHCVGGYADRHINGITTILFLRRADNPNHRLVTIEISGNTIRQAHGWDDERTSCPDNPRREPPQKLYADFFDTWTAWLKAGSKRSKDGSPKLPRVKKEAKSA